MEIILSYFGNYLKKGFKLGSVLLVVLLVIGGMNMKPLINDITTDFENPPQFMYLQAKRPKANYTYDIKMQSKQEEGYEDIHPLPLKGEPIELIKKIISIITTNTQWEIVSVNEHQFRIESVATTKVLRFKDDIVLELRPQEGEIVELHMRSKSRLGKGDLGANAKRIKSFFGLVQSQISN